MSGREYEATPGDGEAMLHILESSPARGSIELLYTRRPDAYMSYRKEFGEPHVFVSRDGQRVVGTCAELVRDVYIGGRPARVAYLCGLKKDAFYPGPVGFGTRFLRGLVRDDIDFYYCSVLSDNNEALRMFSKGRSTVNMSLIGEYTTYILAPGASLRTHVKGYTFRRAERVDEGMILAFLNREGRKRDLFPVLTSINQCYGLSAEDFYLLMRGDTLLATAALWDQTGYKQYVVKAYRGIMKYARLMNPILSGLGYVRLPPVNRVLRFPMLSFFLCLDDDADCYRIFLNEINREIGKNYDMYAIGLPKTHFATGIYRSMKSIHFDTRLYAVDFLGQTSHIPESMKGSLYPECAFL